MTKPHEEEWRTDELDARHVEADAGGEAFRIAEAYAGTRLDGGNASRIETALLISAAPDMARALLEIRDAINSGTLSLDDLQSVVERPLRKAGVL